MADLSPVQFTADVDAGGRDIVSDTVDGSVAAASARLAELEADTHATVIGDVLNLPHSPVNPAVGVLDNPPFEGPFFPETNPA